MASNRQPFSTTEIPVTRHSKDSAKHSTLRDLPNVPLKSVSSFANEAPESVLKDDAPKICESCDLEAPLIWYCSYCGMDFCDPCWGRAGPHKPGRVGPDGLPHEKANPTIVESLKDILNPPNDAASQKTLHLEDENTKWFGIAKDEQNRPMFQDYGRYAAIMAESNTGDLQSRFPQFVSFIGQTGAGKSTLIKMLVDQQERLHGSRERGFPSPVVGSVTHGNVPTSGDVHLYSDPSTYASEYPMLLADCEGLEGGENVPISAQYLDKSSTTQENEKKDDAFKPKKLSASPLNPIRRELKWATSPELSKRQYGVTELFPRLLYSFSDVIVFVLRNPKYVVYFLAKVPRLTDYIEHSNQRFCPC